MGWTLCYLINGDSEGLTEADKVLIDEWWEQKNVVTVSPASEEEGNIHPYFSHYPAFGMATDVLDCNIMVM